MSPRLGRIMELLDADVIVDIVLPRGCERSLLDGKVVQVPKHVIHDDRFLAPEESATIVGFAMVPLVPSSPMVMTHVQCSIAGRLFTPLAFQGMRLLHRPFRVPKLAPFAFKVGWQGPEGPELPFRVSVHLVVSRDVSPEAA